MEEKVDRYQEYEKICGLIDKEEFSTAKDLIEENFISKGYFGYRYVTELYLSVSYAEHHGEFPSEFEKIFNEIETTSEDKHSKLIRFDRIATTAALYLIPFVLVMIVWLILDLNQLQLYRTVGIIVIVEFLVVLAIRTYTARKGRDDE